MRFPVTNAIPLQRQQTEAQERARAEQAARGLESQFAQMLLKSMRSATPGDPFGGDTTYREMYDRQLADELTKGRGLGLQPMIVRQLLGGTSTPAASDDFLPLRKPAAPMALPQADTPSGLPLPAGLRGGVLALAPSDSGTSLQAVALSPAQRNLASLSGTLGNTAACTESAPLDCSSPEAFARSIWPHAQKAAAELGVPAKALVAQAALETGWGRRLAGHESAVNSHNLFGIKAGRSWQGQQVHSATHEYVNGQRVSERAAFRSYAGPAASFADYVQLLRRPRYAAALSSGGDIHQFASALQRAGYATDPAYAAKISAIADGPTLRRALAGLEV